jgi:hypothetical protein
LRNRSPKSASRGVRRIASSHDRKIASSHDRKIASSHDRKIASSHHPMAPTLCLSLHADYRCQRSGACCTSGWPIHVERHRLVALRRAIDDGRLTYPLRGEGACEPFIEVPELPPDAAAVLRTCASGRCVFYADESGLCTVQRALGHDLLPAACQHFPRRALVEPDRVAVSLSHYCPTVARLAFRQDVGLEIVQAPDTLAGHITLEGLDARDALPPLVRPGLLADRGGYHAWERAVVGILALDTTPEAALAEISALTDRLRRWTPRHGEMRRAVEEPDRIRLDLEAEPGGNRRQATSAAHWIADYEAVRSAVPPGFAARPAPAALDSIDARWVAGAWPGFSRPLRQFLAAHAFGSWCAYHGMGLRTVVRAVEAALSVVRVEAGRLSAVAERPLDEAILVEAMRAADLLLVHLADPKALAARLSEAEQAGPRR